MPLAWLSRGTIVLPPLPVWQGESRRVLWPEIAGVIARHSPTCRIEDPSDAAFDSVPEECLVPAIRWTQNSLAAQGVAYGPEAFDCENFQRELCQTLAKMARRAGRAAAPCTGGLRVRQVTSWGGVPDGGVHEVAAVFGTYAGLLVIEPQAAAVIRASIEAYPNRTQILAAEGF